MIEKQEWYSAKELAGLEGLPGTVQGVIKRAKKEEWEKRNREKVKGFEYHFNSFPQVTQNALRKQAGIDVVNQSHSVFENCDAYQAGKALADLTNETQLENERKKLKGFRKFSALPEGNKKERAKAFKWVVEALWAYRHTVMGTKKVTRFAFVAAFSKGEFEVPDWVREHMPKYQGQRGLTEPSLHRWEDNYRKHGIISLVDGYGQNTGNTVIDKNPVLMKVILGAMLNSPHILAGDILKLFNAKYSTYKLPSKRSLQRWTKQWKEANHQLWLYMTNPDKWKNVCMVAFGSHFERIERLNQVWELDSTPGDWMLTDGRHSIIGVIDLYSRRLKLLVSKTSKASAICQLYRRAILDWGMNEVARTDNGKDYVSDQFTDVLYALNSIHELCLPFASEEKGTIERVLQTMTHGILHLLPGFIGHNVAERKVIEAMKSFAQRIGTKDELVEVSISGDELQVILDQWVEHEYHQNPHSGLDGKTPFEVATAWTQPIKRIHDERALDALLMDVAKLRTMGKKGIRIDSHFYFSGALLSRLGHEFRIKRDMTDMGRIYVYEALTPDFVCVAECPALLGISQKEAAAGMKSKQRKLLTQQSKELKAFKKEMKINIPQVVLDHKIEQSKNVTVLPKRSEPYTTPDLEAAGEAARAMDGPQTTKTTTDRDAFIAEFNQPVATINQDNPKEVYKRWARIEKMINDGTTVDDKDRRGLEAYKNSGRFDGMKEFFEEFGLSVEA